MLRRTERFGVAESQALQQDVVAVPARALVPLLEGIVFEGDAEGPLLGRARQLLLVWDQQMHAQSAGAAIFAAFHIRLAADYVGQVLPPRAERDPALVRSASARVLLDGLQRPGPARDLLVAGAFRAAVLELRERLGPNPLDWKWGTLHQARFAHRLGVGKQARPCSTSGPCPGPGTATR